MVTKMDQSSDRSVLVSRRKFLAVLGGAGFTTAVAAALSMPLGTRPAQARGPEQHGGAASPHRWGMVIDLSKCIGCQYCVYACQAVNDTTDELRWNIYVLDQTATGEPFHMTRPCQHCQNAPCASVCPVAATYQRGDGLVVMDYDRCIGCRYCMVACPYDVRASTGQPGRMRTPTNRSGDHRRLSAARAVWLRSVRSASIAWTAVWKKG